MPPREPLLPCCRRVTTNGKPQLIFETVAGQRIILEDSPGSVLIEDSNGNTIRLESSGITINASAKVTLAASQLHISAGTVTVDAGMAKFSGVVQADTIIANSVIANSYTPGAGNIF